MLGGKMGLGYWLVAELFFGLCRFHLDRFAPKVDRWEPNVEKVNLHRGC